MIAPAYEQNRLDQLKRIVVLVLGIGFIGPFLRSKGSPYNIAMVIVDFDPFAVSGAVDISDGIDSVFEDLFFRDLLAKGAQAKENGGNKQ